MKRAKKKTMKGKGPHGLPMDYEVLSMELEIAIEVGLLTKTEASMVAQLASDISNLVSYAKYYPDSLAVEQIQVIHKLLHPEVYELPASMIKQLAQKYQGVPAHNRAVAVRHIMFDIAEALEPVHGTGKSVLGGPEILSGAVKLAPLKSMERYMSKAKAMALRAKVAPYWKPNVTLQSLAIRIYLDELERAGVQGVDAANLRADMRALAKWERANTPGRGADANPTSALWVHLSSRQVPEDLKKAIKPIVDDEAKGR